RTSLFSEELIGRWMRHYGLLVDAVAADPERPVAELEALLDEDVRAEQRQAQEALRAKRRAVFGKR
ncbi:MAG TPA: hypothetical protein VGV85_02065, partial [Longimicrobiaceae bacterium]|nr:hypothetical protein [Longimicrobiaceae bacterium]